MHIIFPKGNMLIKSEAELGALIRQRRKSQKLSIVDLAMLVPCSPRLLSELERGKRGVNIGVTLQLMALLGFVVDVKGREEIRR